MNRIGVIGAGTMGAGIAQVALAAGFHVVLYDLNQGALEAASSRIGKGLAKAVELGKMAADAAEAAKSNLQLVTELEQVIADVVIEAAVERLDIKQDIFARLEAVNAPDALLTTNTSSLSVTAIGAGLQHGGRFAGLHFFNPAPAMKLVEITAGLGTHPDTVDQLKQLCARLGKTSVTCQDQPGFIVNRVARPYYTEALYLANQQGADLENIDDLLEATGFKMGPFRLMDMIGNDINFAVTSSLFEAFHYEPRFRPSLIQQKKVEARQLGRKTGRGFYSYS